MSNYPPGCNDDDPHFDMSSVGDDNETEEDDRVSIPCSRCGRLTTRDPIYDDLCYHCCRAWNE